jgi:ABC-type uncharacterized transport system permease subunit
MFNNLTDRLSNSFKALQGKNKLSESNINVAFLQVRRALLEADVALEVIKVLQDNAQHKHQKSVFLLLSFAIITHTLTFTNFWTTNGVFFGLANSASFSAWLISVLLFLSSLSKPVHALGVLVYPLTALSLAFSLLFPDTAGKTISLSIASHVFLSITAYALLALAVCQSVLLKIQENYLHAKKINSFINKLPSLLDFHASQRV